MRLQFLFQFPDIEFIRFCDDICVLAPLGITFVDVAELASFAAPVVPLCHS